MNMINKPSEAIRFAITSGMYVGNEVYQKPTEYGQPAEFMCHSIERMTGKRDFVAVVTDECAAETLSLIKKTLKDDYALSSHIRRLDKQYDRLVDKYSFEHRFCFNRRLKWWDKFIANLEKEGK